MEKIAHLFSRLFSPLLVPSFGTFLAMWFSLLVYLPEKTRWLAILATVIITGIFPMLVIGSLFYMQRISDLGLNEKKDRLIPYIVIILCYAGCAVYFFRANAPAWFALFFAGAGLAALVSTVVNTWWKISAHGAAMGGLVAMLFRIVANGVNAVELTPVISVVIVVAGIVGTSRILLGRHTLMQVVAGFVNGFVCVYACSALG